MLAAEIKPVFLFKCTEAGGCQGTASFAGGSGRVGLPVQPSDLYGDHQIVTLCSGLLPARWVPAALTLPTREGTNVVTPPFVDEDTEVAGAFFYSLFNKYLWRTYYVQGMVLNSSNTAIHERDKNSCTRGAYVSEERGSRK